MEHMLAGLPIVFLTFFRDYESHGNIANKGC